MTHETDRLTCSVANSVAHVRFKKPDVIEYTEAAHLGPELRHLADSFDFRALVLDCAALNCVTSTALEAFVSVHLRCRRKGREVRIANANGLVRDLLRVTHLDRIMRVYDSLEDALQLEE